MLYDPRLRRREKLGDGKYHPMSMQSTPTAMYTQGPAAKSSSPERVHSEKGPKGPNRQQRSWTRNIKKEQKHNPFQVYEDKEIKLQQKRRWLGEVPEYLAYQINALQQNRVHLRQNQKDLGGEQAYEDRLFL